MATTKHDHIYRLTAEVMALNLNGTITINFLSPATGFSTQICIPQDDFNLGDKIVFELAGIYSQEEWKEKFETEGEVVNA